MRNLSILLIMCAFIGCNGGSAPPVPPGPPPTPGPVQAQLLDAHNAERAKRNLAPFTQNALLVQAAQAHADFMAKRGKMAHYGIGDGTPSDRMNAVGYKAIAGGENIGWNYSDVQAVMIGWMNSSGHRAAILGSYKEYGGAVAYGAKNDPYWCSVFGTPGGLRIIGVPIDKEVPPPVQFKSGEGYLVEPHVIRR